MTSWVAQLGSWVAQTFAFRKSAACVDQEPLSLAILTR
jgi:hypothetical protein